MSDPHSPQDTGPTPTPRQPPAGDNLPRFGRLIGVDFGTKRHGVAVSTPEQTIASPLDLCTRRGAAVDAKWFRELLEEYPAIGFVVGLPLHSGGEEGSKAHEARQFGAWLKQALGLPVTFWDERYTSATAEDWMLEAGLSRDERKARVDMLAAQIMLQSYLESRGGSSQAR